MPNIGDLIGNYRLLAPISTTPLCTLYAAEHMFANTNAVLLLLCNGVTITTAAEQDKLLHEAINASIQYDNNSITIQDAGTTNQHPYLVTVYGEEIQSVLHSYMQFLEDILHSTHSQYPDNQSLLFDTFLHTLVIHSTSVANNDTTIKGSRTQAYKTAMKQNAALWKGRVKGKEPRKRLITLLAAVLLILLIWGGFFLHINVSATNATVTITPVTKKFSQQYNLLVTADPGTNPNAVQGRQITYTSSQKVQTVAATGQGTHAATRAKGSVVFSQLQHTPSNVSRDFLDISSLQGASGVTITTDSVVDITNRTTVTVPAHAAAGSAGNIPAGDLDAQIEFIDPITKAVTGTGFIANPAPFTGGRDATPFTFVKASDIDGVVNTFVGQLTPDAKVQAQKLIHSDEQMMHDIQCATNSSPNHAANSEANDVTIKVSVTCSTLVYTNEALRNAATVLYQKAGTTKFGSMYGVVGDMVTGKPVQSGIGSFPITVDGIWAFQYTPTRLQALSQSIAGKTSQDALKVLQKRPDILNVNLSTSGGIGSAVPTNLSAIQYVVTKVPGLHA